MTEQAVDQAWVETVVLPDHVLEDPPTLVLEGGQVGRLVQWTANTLVRVKAAGRVVAWALPRALGWWWGLARWSPVAARDILLWLVHWLLVTEVRQQQRRLAVTAQSPRSTNGEAASASSGYDSKDALLWRKRRWRWGLTVLPAAVAAVWWWRAGWPVPVLGWQGRLLTGLVVAVLAAGLGALVEHPADVVDPMPASVPGTPTAALVAEWFADAGITTNSLAPVVMAHDPVYDTLGRGFVIRLWLPKGVTTAKVRDRMTELASAAQRNRRCLFLDDLDDTGAEENVIELFVADADPMTLPPAPWPLLVMDALDSFAAWPLGYDGRIRPVLVETAEQHALIVSRPRRGKTTVLRAFAYQAVLDPRVILAVFDGGRTADYEPFRRFCEPGAFCREGDVEGAATDYLERLVQQHPDRMARLAAWGRETGQDGTRITTASARVVRPVHVILDEVHKLVNHPVHGARAQAALYFLLTEGAKAGYLIRAATQRTGGKVLPVPIRSQFGIRVALKVSSWQESQAALGDNAKAIGLDASTLSGRKGEALIVVDADDAEPVNTWLRIVPALPEVLGPALERIAAVRAAARPEPAPAVEDGLTIVQRVLRAWPEGVSRMHAGTLAEALGVDQEALRDELAAAGVQQRPQVTIRGVNRRGYHLEDVRGA